VQERRRAPPAGAEDVERMATGLLALQFVQMDRPDVGAPRIRTEGLRKRSFNRASSSPPDLTVRVRFIRSPDPHQRIQDPRRARSGGDTDHDGGHERSDHDPPRRYRTRPREENWRAEPDRDHGDCGSRGLPSSLQHHFGGPTAPVSAVGGPAYTRAT
jgi:hypothetical protein